MELETQTSKDAEAVRLQTTLPLLLSSNPYASEINSAIPVQRLSPAALAYVGDAVFELFIRTYYLTPPKRLKAYHEQVVTHVRAETQARYLKILRPHLTEAEQDIARRGRNASPRGPKRLDPEIYQQATGLETLLGYLYLTDSNRLTEVLAYLQPELA
ncbi:MAG TPA: ribonuclease III domain-containing protein [Trichocoleus sp.]